MKKVTALDLRQSLGKIVEAILDDGEPILLEKGRRPVAVLISIRDFQERFAEKDAGEARAKILEEMDALSMRSIDPTPGVEVLRELRGSA
ncbi:MAG: type II toxin-antitoxin system Phd/YefM family antitoxin [Actinomycetota bacterium]